jgi:hypothetical protein
MEFWGKHPIRSKIVLQDRLLEQVSYLNHLGCEISKEIYRDIDKQEVLERTILRSFLTLFKSKLSFGKSQFYYILYFIHLR